MFKALTPAQQRKKDKRQLRINGITLSSLFFILGVFTTYAYLFMDLVPFLILQIGLMCYLFVTFFFIMRLEVDIFSPFLLCLIYTFTSVAFLPIVMVFRPEHHEDLLSYMFRKAVVEVDYNAMELAMWYMLLFVFFMIVGYILGVGRWLAARLPVPPSDWSPRSMRLLLPILVCCGLIGYGFLLAATGMNPLQQYSNPFVFRYNIFERPGLFHFRNLTFWCMWTAFWVPFLYYYLQRDVRLSKTLRIYLWAVFFLLLMFSFGFGQRLLVVVPIVGFFFVKNLTRGKIGILPMLLISVFLLWFMNFYQVYRGLGWGGLDLQVLYEETFSIKGGLLDYFLDLGIRSTSAIHILPQVFLIYPAPGYELLYGKSYLYLPTLLFPMSVFPWRPMFTDKYLMTMMVLTGNEEVEYGLGYGQLAELYVNFLGYGIAAGGLFWGIAISTVENYARIHKNNPAAMLLYTTGTNNFFVYIVLITLICTYSINTVELMFYTTGNIILCFLLAKRR